MSFHASSRETPASNETGSDSPLELLALLDDDHTLTILQAIQTEPKSARALADECDASRPTIYRRLNSLEEFGLVSADMTYDADGHHRRRYRATLETVTVGIEEDGFSANVATSEDDVAREAPNRRVAGD